MAIRQATCLVQALCEGLSRLAKATAQVPLRGEMHELQPVVVGDRLIATARLQHLHQLGLGSG